MHSRVLSSPRASSQGDRVFFFSFLFVRGGRGGGIYYFASKKINDEPAAQQPISRSSIIKKKDFDIAFLFVVIGSFAS